MSLFSRRIVYDRKRLLERAERAEKRRRVRRAIVLYRQLLAAEPRNPELHERLAPLLAHRGRIDEAWESFGLAIEAREQAGQDAEAEALAHEAAKALPAHLAACRRSARAALVHQHPRAALEVLWKGAQRLGRRRRTRGQAILLLTDAREIEAWSVPVVLKLGQLLAKEGRPGEALFLLDQLESRVRGEKLRDVRGLICRIEPSLRHGWAWFRSARAVRRRGGGPAALPAAGRLSRS